MLYEWLTVTQMATEVTKWGASSSRHYNSLHLVLDSCAHLVSGIRCIVCCTDLLHMYALYAGEGFCYHHSGVWHSPIVDPDLDPDY